MSKVKCTWQLTESEIEWKESVATRKLVELALEHLEWVAYFVKRHNYKSAAIHASEAAARFEKIRLEAREGRPCNQAPGAP